jgi:hypothetical protein
VFGTNEEIKRRVLCRNACLIRRPKALEIDFQFRDEVTECAKREESIEL